MARILTKEQCEELLAISYEEYQRITIVDKPKATTAADTRKFNERLTDALIELTHLIAKARSDEKTADYIFKTERASALAKLAEAKIRAKARTKDDIGKSDETLQGITAVDPVSLTQDAMKAMSENYAYKASGTLRNVRRTSYLNELWESLVKLGKRVGDELVAFGIENKMANNINKERNV